MAEQPNKPNSPPSLVPVEAGLFGALFGFHNKAVTLLRQSSLNNEKLDLVAERIKTLLDNVTPELMGMPQLNLMQRLEDVYEEVQRLVAELSCSPDDGKAG